MAPSKIEKLLMNTGLVVQAMVYGESVESFLVVST